MPSAGQGALAIEIASGRDDLEQWLRPLHDRATARLVVFVSPNAIVHALAHRTAVAPALTIGVVGPGSVAALRSAGIARPAYRIVSPRADAVAAGKGAAMPAAPRFDSESLFDALVRILPPDLWRGGARALLVRGSGGRAWLADRLRASGIEVDEVESYRRSKPETSAAARDAMQKLIDADPAPIFVVTSSEGLANLVELVPESHPDPAAVRAWLKSRALRVHTQDQSACSPGRRVLPIVLPRLLIRYCLPRRERGATSEGAVRRVAGGVDCFAATHDQHRDRQSRRNRCSLRSALRCQGRKEQ